MELFHNETDYQKLVKKLSSVRQDMSDPLVMKTFVNDFAYLHTCSSGALDGNPLNIDQVVALIDNDRVDGRFLFGDFFRTKCLYDAMQNYMIPFSVREIDADWISSVNAAVTDGSGRFRKENVGVGNITRSSVYYPPDYKKVPELMKEYYRMADPRGDANHCDEMDNVTKVFSRIAQSHLQFEFIHPYLTGNGRTGRMILNQQLINNSYLPVSFDDATQYMQALRQYDANGEMTAMIHILVEAECKALDRIPVIRDYLDKKAKEKKARQKEEEQ